MEPVRRIEQVGHGGWLTLLLVLLSAIMLLVLLYYVTAVIESLPRLPWLSVGH
ncbi:hypothetical protein [Halobaculum sp. EA56]|uniref:hypothetical protein n=1 Tax=Halobaculum sp. EA56 TaxID=3421648 RepID=UPI003EBAA8B2